jgi:hypothetical protein
MDESIQDHVSGVSATKPKMIDLLQAKIIDLTCDETGKVWVNVDGKCLIRIGRVEYVSLKWDASYHKSHFSGSTGEAIPVVNAEVENKGYSE